MERRVRRSRGGSTSPQNLTDLHDTGNEKSSDKITANVDPAEKKLPRTSMAVRGKRARSNKRVVQGDETDAPNKATESVSAKKDNVVNSDTETGTNTLSVDRIHNTTLSYSEESDNEFIMVIRDQVLAGDAPLVSQNSIAVIPNIDGFIQAFESKDDKIPKDYTPATKSAVSGGKSNNPEVKVL